MTALIARGADVNRQTPLASSPSALETALYFERDELARQLAELVERRSVN